MQQWISFYTCHFTIRRINSQNWDWSKDKCICNFDRYFELTSTGLVPIYSSTSPHFTDYEECSLERSISKFHLIESAPARWHSKSWKHLRLSLPSYPMHSTSCLSHLQHLQLWLPFLPLNGGSPHWEVGQRLQLSNKLCSCTSVWC